MTDESRASEPRLPNDRSTNVESVALSIARLIKNVVSSIVAFAAIDIIRRNTVDAFSSTSAFIFLAMGIVIFVVGVILDTPTAITFIGNGVRGVSRLRHTLRRTGVAAPFALAVWIGGRNRRWQVEDLQAALAESHQPIRYSLGLVVAATWMRLRDLGGLLVKTVCWVLATDTRTWTPLTGLLLWGGIETTLDTGLGAAILAVISGGAMFHTGVTWGRNRLGVEAQQRKSTE